MRIAFCGSGFPDAPRMLRDRLPSDEIVICAEDAPPRSVAEAEVVIPAMTRIDDALMAKSRIRLIQQWGAGVEGVDLEAAKRHGIWVANVPSGDTFNAESVADLALLFTLELLRDLRQAQANVRAGRLGAPLGRSLAQCTVCLFGLGNIAAALAPRLKACGARMIGISRRPDPAKSAQLGLSDCFAVEDRLTALAKSDVAVLCLPLTSETRGIVGAAELAALPRGALLINVGRGALIDYPAFLTALESGHLGGAGLDVYWKEPIDPADPLLAFPNVIATPHVGGVTEQSYAAIMETVAGNIERLRRGEPPINRVA
ncbi:2-hydroxyacid dehydrogenase [Telmatospirillum siberiense]|uniref:Hydroxyacid dehydrogenase n=1 Tax=Telmatospirillum siberiense TaxID=382514 RepID=A0A2N3PY35_9PROT|nr:2-hydroxyacid dehydrogenase [Telmatospirillum siberiense]PKU25322.1 hydroxyacid dehydrogenase [Telmatospirillum siberiense]